MNTALRPEVAAHLAEEAGSPEELRELQATLALLGALPQVAPRRTFILTPEQVAEPPARRGRRRFAWVWPTRWATALAAICFAITLGLGQGAAPAPPPPVAAVAPTATPVIEDPDARTPLVQIFAVDTPTTIPVATTAAMPKLVPPAPAATAADWRPAQVTLGALTALGAFFGFMLPPFLRRRSVASA